MDVPNLDTVLSFVIGYCYVIHCFDSCYETSVQGQVFCCFAVHCSEKARKAHSNYRLYYRIVNVYREVACTCARYTVYCVCVSVCVCRLLYLLKMKVHYRYKSFYVTFSWIAICKN